MAKEIIVKNIEHLSQQEGLTDQEIGDILGYARGSVHRIRKSHGISTANYDNRKDKPCKCMKCEKDFMIRRCETNKIFCPECEVVESKAYNKMWNDKFAHK